MAKIQLTYEVPEGDLCMHHFEDKEVVTPCKYLFDTKWCTLFGSSPTIVYDGHSVMKRKLHVCRHATIQEEKPQSSESAS